MLKSPKYPVTFNDIKFYYPNLIDYSRLAMCILATFTIRQELSLITATLIFGSILLDWIDGPVARAYNMCSVIGDGIDWACDLYAEILMLIWWCKLEPTLEPYLILVGMNELFFALIDFAETACDRFQGFEPQKGFFIVVEWCTPGKKFNRLGTFVWIAHPIFITARCLALELNSPESWSGELLTVIQ